MLVSLNPFIGKLLSILELSRPWAWITIVLLMIGARLGSPHLASNWQEFLVSSLGVALIVAGGFAINDLLDHDLDKVVHPERAIPMGRLSPTSAGVFVALAFLAGLGFMALSGIVSLIFGIVWISLLAIYSHAKSGYGPLGNIIVSLLVTLAVVYGYIDGRLVRPEFSLMLLAMTVFVAMLCRELLKDVEDMSGERGLRKTLPMQVGVGVTYNIAATLVIIDLLLTLSFLLVSELYVALVLAIPIMVYGGLLVVRLLNGKEEQAASFVRTMKVGMVCVVIILATVHH